MAHPILNDNTVKLATPRRSDGQVRRLRVEWNTRRGAVGFSGQTQSGEWVNAYLMLCKFFTLCDNIKLLLNAKEEVFYCEDVDEGKEKKFAFRIGVGRDAEGIIYLEIAMPNKEALRFLFLPERQYRSSVNGKPLSKNELSRRKASSWVQILTEVMLKESEAGKEEYKPQQGGGYNKQGGGYQKKQWNNNQGGGNYQKKQWNNNQGGGQSQGNYNNGGQSAPVADGSLDDYLTI